VELASRLKECAAGLSYGHVSDAIRRTPPVRLIKIAGPPGKCSLLGAPGLRPGALFVLCLASAWSRAGLARPNDSTRPIQKLVGSLPVVSAGGFSVINRARSSCVSPLPPGISIVRLRIDLVARLLREQAPHVLCSGDEVPG
jgi:hypothetical protein